MTELMFHRTDMKVNPKAEVRPADGNTGNQTRQKLPEHFDLQAERIKMPMLRLTYC
jgi:hypothetical protein